MLIGLKRLQGFRASDRRNLVLLSNALLSEIDGSNPAIYIRYVEVVWLAQNLLS